MPMPTVRVQLLAGRTPDQKRACGAAITDALVTHCGARAEAVYVVFEDVTPEDWIVGRDSVADRHARAGKAG
jgi:4-oxalocrotonate tautomerase